MNLSAALAEFAEIDARLKASITASYPNGGRPRSPRRLLALADALYFNIITTADAMRLAGYSESVARAGVIKHNGRMVRPRDHPFVRERIARLQAAEETARMAMDQTGRIVTYAPRSRAAQVIAIDTQRREAARAFALASQSVGRGGRIKAAR